MKTLSLFPVALLVMMSSHVAHAQGDVPSQLGASPVMPPPARPRLVPALRQLDTAPGAPSDSARRAVMAVPLTDLMPAPTLAGQLPGSSPPTPRFRIGLKNGMVYSANDVERKNAFFGHYYLLLDGWQKFEFPEIRFYEDVTGYYVRATLPNSSRETTLRREKSGRISLYALTHFQYGLGTSSFDDSDYFYWISESSNGGPSSYSYSGYRTVKSEYFSKDDGLMQSLTTDNLILATRDNAGAQKLLLQSRRNQHVMLGSYIVGGGLLVVGLFQSLRPGIAQTSPLVYAAIPVFIIPLVLLSKQANNQRQAIALYNAER